MSLKWGLVLINLFHKPWVSFRSLKMSFFWWASIWSWSSSKNSLAKLMYNLQTLTFSRNFQRSLFKAVLQILTLSFQFYVSFLSFPVFFLTDQSIFLFGQISTSLSFVEVILSALPFFSEFILYVVYIPRINFCLESDWGWQRAAFLSLSPLWKLYSSYSWAFINTEQSFWANLEQDFSSSCRNFTKRPL